MKPVIGINGFGRIGFCVARTAIKKGWEIAAINASRKPSDIAQIFAYDSTHGRFDGTVFYNDDEGYVVINGKKILTIDERDPELIEWKKYGVEYVVECTGKFKTLKEAGKHLVGGVQRVIISAPSDDAPNFVYGVNHEDYDAAEMQVVSAASCTTNCVAPIVKVLNDAFGIESGYMLTTHAMTSKQPPLDGFDKKDPRIGRAGPINIIPTTTGATKAVGKVIPDVLGKLTGLALRVPVVDGSIATLTLNLKCPVTKEDLLEVVDRVVSEDPVMNQVIEYDATNRLVSSDIIGNTHSCVFDEALVEVTTPTCVTVSCWYDNEMSYTAQMFRLMEYMGEQEE